MLSLFGRGVESVIPKPVEENHDSCFSVVLLQRLRLGYRKVEWTKDNDKTAPAGTESLRQTWQVSVNITWGRRVFAVCFAN